MRSHFLARYMYTTHQNLKPVSKVLWQSKYRKDMWHYHFVINTGYLQTFSNNAEVAVRGADDSHLNRLMTKPTKWHVRPAKTQISLCIRPVWSESSLSAWRELGCSATHWAHSEDWSDWADAQADLSLRWAHMPFCWFSHEAAHFSFVLSNDVLCSKVSVFENLHVYDIKRHSNIPETVDFLCQNMNDLSIMLQFCFFQIFYENPDFKWGMSWQNLFLPYANNKGADQPAHPLSRPVWVLPGRKPRRQVFLVKRLK